MIQIRSVLDVECFVALATSCEYPIYLDDGNYRVNGKSFMEMFCLELTRPLHVIAECPPGELDRLRYLVGRLLPE